MNLPSQLENKNKKMMKTRFLLGALLLLVCSLTGCSDDDNNGGNNGSEPVTPFSLEKTYYEVRLERSVTDIPIINGSGDISLFPARQKERNHHAHPDGQRDGRQGNGRSKSNGLLYRIRHCRKQSPHADFKPYTLSGKQ